MEQEREVDELEELFNELDELNKEENPMMRMLMVPTCCDTGLL